MKRGQEVANQVQESLKELHRNVDRRAAELSRRHGPRLRCRIGCTPCCRDDITVFQVEAERIRLHHAGLLEHGRPHPAGGCAFLDDEGACRIYEDRPYVCRTQGLPLRWIQEDGQGQPAEYRDICPLNEEGPPLEKMAEADCWTIGPAEGHLAQLQRRAGGDTPERIALRDLFRRPSV